MFKLFRNKADKLGIERNGIYLDFSGEENRYYFVEEDDDDLIMNCDCSAWVLLEDFLGMQTKQARLEYEKQLERENNLKPDEYRKIYLKRVNEELFIKVNLTMSIM